MKVTSVSDMFQSIAPRYDVANDVLSFGTHRVWKKKAVSMMGICAGDVVVDLCTGTGDLAFRIARVVGDSGKVIGIDFVPGMLELAESKRQAHPPYPALEFVQGDAMNLDLPENIADGVSIAFGIRNVPDVGKCLSEIRRILKPRGTLMVLEFGQPFVPGFALLYRFYSRHLMPFVGGLLTGNKAAYEYLPETSAQFPSGKKFVEILQNAQFSNIRAIPLFGGVAYIYVGSTSLSESGS